MQHYLDFERPIAELESKIKELRRLSDGDGVNIVEEITRLQAKLDRNKITEDFVAAMAAAHKNDERVPLRQ